MFDLSTIYLIAILKVSTFQVPSTEDKEIRDLSNK